MYMQKSSCENVISSHSLGEEAFPDIREPRILHFCIAIPYINLYSTNYIKIFLGFVLHLCGKVLCDDGALWVNQLYIVHIVRGSFLFIISRRYIQHIFIHGIMR